MASGRCRVSAADNWCQSWANRNASMFRLRRSSGSTAASRCQSSTLRGPRPVRMWARSAASRARLNSGMAEITAGRPAASTTALSGPRRWHCLSVVLRRLRHLRFEIGQPIPSSRYLQQHGACAALGHLIGLGTCLVCALSIPCNALFGCFECHATASPS